MITVDTLQPHFPTDSIQLYKDPNLAAQLKAAVSASKHFDLDEKIEYQFFTAIPLMGPPTNQCWFSALRGGAGFPSDPSLWPLGNWYTVCNELEAIA